MKNVGLPGTLVLIRHAESKRNKDKRGEVFFKDAAARDAAVGVPDHLTPLSEQGLLQAPQAGQALKTQFGVPHEIINSGYTRTIQTTEGILTAYTEKERGKIIVRSDHRVRERSPGWGYDLTVDEASTHFAWLQDHFKRNGQFFSQPPGGESLVQVVDRLEPFVDKLRKGRPGRTTFIVTHGNTVRCLRFLIEGLTYAQVETMRWPSNCAMVAYEFDVVGRPTLIAENKKLCTE